MKDKEKFNGRRTPVVALDGEVRETVCISRRKKTAVMKIVIESLSASEAMSNNQKLKNHRARNRQPKSGQSSPNSRQTGRLIVGMSPTCSGKAARTPTNRLITY